MIEGLLWQEAAADQFISELTESLETLKEQVSRAYREEQGGLLLSAQLPETPSRIPRPPYDYDEGSRR